MRKIVSIFCTALILIAYFTLGDCDERNSTVTTCVELHDPYLHACTKDFGLSFVLEFVEWGCSNRTHLDIMDCYLPDFCLPIGSDSPSSALCPFRGMSTRRSLVDFVGPGSNTSCLLLRPRMPRIHYLSKNHPPTLHRLRADARRSSRSSGAHSRWQPDMRDPAAPPPSTAP
jgi:hypothetical protein